MRTASGAHFLYETMLDVNKNSLQRQHIITESRVITVSIMHLKMKQISQPYYNLRPIRGAFLVIC